VCQHAASIGQNDSHKINYAFCNPTTYLELCIQIKKMACQTEVHGVTSALPVRLSLFLFRCQDWISIGDIRTVRLLPERRLLVVGRGDDAPSCTFKVCAGDEREKFLLRARNATEERRWKNALLAAVARGAQRADIVHSSSGVIYV